MIKKLLSITLAVLFLLSCVPVSLADNDVFSGLVTESNGSTVCVANSFGTVLQFLLAGGVAAPVPGAMVDVTYTGSITSQMVATGIVTTSMPISRSVSGTVRSVSGSSFILECSDTVMITVEVSAATRITGSSDTLAVGQKVNVTYNEIAQYLSTVNVATAIDIQKAAKEKEKAAETQEDTTNKQLSGTVTALSSSKITIKTSKGKKWTFKRSDKKTTYMGKYNLEVGCKVTITYDGYASKNPYAKICKTTKAAPEKPEEPKLYKRSGTCTSFGGMVIGVDSSFYADVAYCRTHTGDGYHGEGTQVTVTYYIGSDNEFYATKIDWKG